MKGMTNALPVLIDASTLATKSDISDMETKTNANATFATKTALTTLQNATKVAVENFAITESADKVTITTTAIDGATSKSEDIPAVTDTMAGIITAEWFVRLKKLYEDSLSYDLTFSIAGVVTKVGISENINNPPTSFITEKTDYTISTIFNDLKPMKNYYIFIYTASSVNLPESFPAEPDSLTVNASAFNNDEKYFTLTVNNSAATNATIPSQTLVPKIAS